MASPVRAKPDNLLGLSMSEARILILGIISQKDGKVDYEKKIAQKGGWKNASSASTTYCNAYRKLQSLAGSNENATTTSTDASAGAATVTPKKCATNCKTTTSPTTAADAVVSSDDDQYVDTPTRPKRQRKAPTKGSSAKEKEVTDEGPSDFKTGNSSGSVINVKVEELGGGLC